VEDEYSIRISEACECGERGEFIDVYERWGGWLPISWPGVMDSLGLR
jgi:hypothetical protein